MRSSNNSATKTEVDVAISRLNPALNTVMKATQTTPRARRATSFGNSSRASMARLRDHARRGFTIQGMYNDTAETRFSRWRTEIVGIRVFLIRGIGPTTNAGLQLHVQTQNTP